MAQNHGGLPHETIFVECRAFVFYHQAGQNRWLEVGEPNVYSRVQLLCNRQGGSTAGLYKILGRLESSGMPTLNLPLTDSVTYVVVQPTWHQIRLLGGIIYGLHFSPDSNGSQFSIIVQNALRSLQGAQSLPVDPRANWTVPSNPPPPVQNKPPAAPLAAQKISDPPSQDAQPNVTALQARERNDARIDALCLSLSEAIRTGCQDKAVELTRKFTIEKLPLSIKLKNPVLVTMNSGADTISLRVVVEDKQSSGGAFTMKVSPSATIERLKQEVFDRFSFPVQVQKWIIGKKIPKPTDTLFDLNVKQSGHTVFLYLLSGKTVGLRRTDADRFGRSHAEPAISSVSGGTGTRVPSVRAPDLPGPLSRTMSASTPDLLSQRAGQASSVASRTERLPTVQDSPPSSVSNQEQSGPVTLPTNFLPPVPTIYQLRDLLQHMNGPGDPRSSPNPPSRESFVNNLLLTAQPAEEERQPEGWVCGVCTYINQPTRPGCEMCSADRPQGYVVPDGARLDERERQRIAEEERSEALFQQDVERQLIMGSQEARLETD